MQATLRTSTGTTQRPTSSKSPSRSTPDYLLITGKYLQHVLQRGILWSKFGRMHNSIILMSMTLLMQLAVSSIFQVELPELCDRGDDWPSERLAEGYCNLVYFGDYHCHQHDYLDYQTHHHNQPDHHQVGCLEVISCTMLTITTLTIIIIIKIAKRNNIQVTIVYVLANIAFYTTLTPAEVLGSEAVAAVSAVANSRDFWGGW